MKMSLVTAAMLYWSRSAWHNASINAVLPDPTGLCVAVSVLPQIRIIGNIPSDTDSEGAVFPVATLNEGHLAVQIGAGTVEDLVGMAVVVEGIMGVADSGVMGVRVRHNCSCGGVGASRRKRMGEKRGVCYMWGSAIPLSVMTRPNLRHYSSPPASAELYNPRQQSPQKRT